MLKYKMKCPKCGKRAFDISGLPTVPLIVELKCPNCHNIVKIPSKGTSKLPNSRTVCRDSVSCFYALSGFLYIQNHIRRL